MKLLGAMEARQAGSAQIYMRSSPNAH